MQTVRIYRLKDLDRRTRARLQDVQLEAARVWMYCLECHRAARVERTHWPNRDDLQRATKGGQFALHSQSIQMVCQQFLANVETSKKLRLHNSRHRYPHHPKKYMTVKWPAQAISRQGKRLILPMGRGRQSFSFHLPDLPEQIGAVSLVWHGGYELHIVVPSLPDAQAPLPSDSPAQAAVDLGEIHQAAVTTSTGCATRTRAATTTSAWRSGSTARTKTTCTRSVHMSASCASAKVERGTSSHCPRCDWKQKPRGRNWACRRCGFVGHRDIVGSMNMHPIAFGSRIGYPTSLTYRRPGPLRDRRQNEELSPGGTS